MSCIDQDAHHELLLLDSVQGAYQRDEQRPSGGFEEYGAPSNGPSHRARASALPLGPDSCARAGMPGRASIARTLRNCVLGFAGTPRASPAGMSDFDIVLDPGHGNHQPEGHSTPDGVRGPGGTLEKDVTLRLALRLAEALGPGARLTRSGDVNLSLGARADVARQARARVFVSLHANEGRPGERGAEAWVHERAGNDSRSLAGRLLAALGALPDSPPHRGVHEGAMAVLTPERLAPETSACLLEVDFLSDPEGERRFCDDVALAGIAASLARALRDHVAGMPSPLPLPTRAQPMSYAGAPRGSTPVQPFPVRPRSVGRYGLGGRKRALLVGINDYTLAPGTALLHGCVADTLAMERLLQGPHIGFIGADISRLNDRQATRSAVLAELRRIGQESQAGDVICFYYSGHGSYTADPGVPGRFAQALFCADGGELLDRELADVAQGLPDGVNLTIILDSCFSGGMGEAASVPDTGIKGRPLPPEMRIDGNVSLMPVGLCVGPDVDPAITGTITNSRLICEPRPNTTVVPYARATLFSAVDFCELAGERNGRGDYTSALERVLDAAAATPSCARMQSWVVEEMEMARQSGLADALQHPMLRAQGSRIDEGFLQPFTASEYGLSLAASQAFAAPRRPPLARQAPSGARASESARLMGSSPLSNGYGHAHGAHELYDN